jgi:hypothetical protein
MPQRPLKRIGCVMLVGVVLANCGGNIDGGDNAVGDAGRPGNNGGTHFGGTGANGPLSPPGGTPAAGGYVGTQPGVPGHTDDPPDVSQGGAGIGPGDLGPGGTGWVGVGGESPVGGFGGEGGALGVAGIGGESGIGPEAGAGNFAGHGGDG